MKFLAILITALLSSQSALACMGATIVLNDDVTLTGEGISFKSGVKFNLNELIKKNMTGNEQLATDSNNIQTHSIVILGGLQDKGGIMSVSYLVKNSKTGDERVYLLKSNYEGNGVRSRDMTPPTSELKKDEKFNLLMTAGC